VLVFLINSNSKFHLPIGFGVGMSVSWITLLPFTVQHILESPVKPLWSYWNFVKALLAACLRSPSRRYTRMLTASTMTFSVLQQVLVTNSEVQLANPPRINVNLRRRRTEAGSDIGGLRRALPQTAEVVFLVAGRLNNRAHFTSLYAWHWRCSNARWDRMRGWRQAYSCQCPWMTLKAILLF